MKFNKLEVTPILDVVGRWKPTEMWSQTSEDDWAVHRDLLDDEGMLVTAIGGFLVRGCGDRVILVDAGLGGHPSVSFFAGFPVERNLISNLASHGVAPSDITDVVFTHLHADHIGWATQRGRVVFESATYRCASADWRHFVGPDEGTTKKLAPVANQMEMWDFARTLFPGFDVLPVPGHTPGSSVVVLSSGTERAMLIGDVVHCAAEFLEPEWEGIGDVDPILAKRARERVARELEGGHTLVAGAHFPELQFGRLLIAEGRRTWVFDER